MATARKKKTDIAGQPSAGQEGIADLTEAMANIIGKSDIQEQAAVATAMQNGSGEVMIQPMQSVAISPRNGAVSKRMMLSWLWFIKRIQDMPEAGTYRFAMAQLLGFLESREYNDVKTDLRNLNATQVEWNNYKDDETSWGVSNLLSQVEIKSTKNGNFIEISLPPRIEKGIRERRGYSELNLLLAKQLRSASALNLYRICVAFETNPSRVTMRDTPESWYPRLAGNPMPKDTVFHYKYFKRDTLQPAIAEINTLSDLEVRLIEHKEGRRVVEIQFGVESKPQVSFELDQGGSEEAELLLTGMLGVGVRRSDALSLLGKYGIKRIQRNLAYTIERKQKLGSELREVAKYLKAAIREDYAEGMESENLHAVKSGSSQQEDIARTGDEEAVLRKEFEAFRRQKVEELFQEFTSKQSEENWAFYLDELNTSGRNNFLLKRATSKGLKVPDVAVDFMNWLAERSWGPISEGDLLKFLLHKNRADIAASVSKRKGKTA